VRQILSPHARDALGIFLVVLALLAVLGLWFDAAGPVGDFLTWLFRGAWGVAALSFPLVGAYWGVLLLRDTGSCPCSAARRPRPPATGRWRGPAGRWAPWWPVRSWA